MTTATPTTPTTGMKIGMARTLTMMSNEPTAGEFYALLKGLGLAGGERPDPSPDPTADISGMVGETVLGVEAEANEYGQVQVVYFVTDRAIWRVYHDQTCSESVYLEEVDTELSALVGGRVVSAEEVSNNNHNDPRAESSETWTFYKLATDAGVYVTMRWWGSSNGYYSETVDVERYPPEYLRTKKDPYEGHNIRPLLRRLWRQYGGKSAS
jgi:hypothetical protein